MPFPQLGFFERFEPALGRELKSFSARLKSYLEIEHAEDGTHVFPWTKVPYRASDYTGNGGMAWTVGVDDLATFQSRKIDSSLLVSGIWNNTSVTAPLNTTLSVNIPNGYVAKMRMQTTCRAIDNGVATTAFCQVQADGTTIDIARIDGANWAASVNNTSIRVHLEFEITE